jgi:hypothetical protein
MWKGGTFRDPGVEIPYPEAFHRGRHEGIWLQATHLRTKKGEAPGCLPCCSPASIGMTQNLTRPAFGVLALHALLAMAAVSVPLLCATPVSSEAVSSAAEAALPPANEDVIVGNAQSLWEKNQLPSPRQLRDWMQQPTSVPLQLPPPSSTPLSVREIAKRATASHVRIGWVFQCNRCANWHANLAGGYAISPDTVATARHILTPPDKMKGDAGYPVAVRGESEVLVISGVWAADTAADTALLRLRTSDLTPLPLNPEVEVGDTVFCLSDPTGEFGYFSTGIVNRFATNPGAKSPNTLSKRLNVSTDWAPGSSGSAVLDACGNAVGHVGSITSIQSQPKGNNAPSHYMTLHWAIPASHVLHLANPK